MKKTALITGGSSGIGLALARKFAADNYDLLLVSLSAQELKTAKLALGRDFSNINIYTFCKDLSVKNAPKEVYAYAMLNNFYIDVLVNNAGFGTYGFINDLDIEQEMNMINVNIMATYHLTRLFLKDMIERDSGKILNISSISALQPNPMLATYGATKAFSHSFGRAINFELEQKKSKVKVITVCPSAVKDTQFKKIAGMEQNQLFDNWMTVTADVVADDAYKALKKNKEFIIPKYRLHLLNKLVSIFSTRFRMKMAWQNLNT